MCEKRSQFDVYPGDLGDAVTDMKRCAGYLVKGMLNDTNEGEKELRLRFRQRRRKYEDSFVVLEASTGARVASVNNATLNAAWVAWMNRLQHPVV